MSERRRQAACLESFICDMSAEKSEHAHVDPVAAAEFDHGLRVLPADPGHIDGVSACLLSEWLP